MLERGSDGVAAKGNRLEALYHLAVATGMRQMEILGLKWTDLDWINQNIEVGGSLRDRMGKESDLFLQKRSSANELWNLEREPMIVVSRRLCHARPPITLDVYGHLIPAMQSDAAEMIDEPVTAVELHPIAPDFSYL